MEKRELSIGDYVYFITPTRKARHALITAVHGDVSEYDRDGEKRVDYPSVNVVFVVPDVKATDEWGRQIERDSSCCHIGNNSAGAHCYCFPEEWTGAAPFDFSNHYMVAEDEYKPLAS